MNKSMIYSNVWEDLARGWLSEYATNLTRAPTTARSYDSWLTFVLSCLSFSANVNASLSLNFAKTFMIIFIPIGFLLIIFLCCSIRHALYRCCPNWKIRLVAVFSMLFLPIPLAFLIISFEHFGFVPTAMATMKLLLTIEFPRSQSTLHSCCFFACFLSFVTALFVLHSEWRYYKEETERILVNVLHKKLQIGFDSAYEFVEELYSSRWRRFELKILDLRVDEDTLIEMYAQHELLFTSRALQTQLYRVRSLHRRIDIANRSPSLNHLMPDTS